MNKEKLLEQMELFIGEMEKLKTALKNGDRETLKGMMAISSERRKYFDRKKGE